MAVPINYKILAYGNLTFLVIFAVVSAIIYPYIFKTVGKDLSKVKKYGYTYLILVLIMAVIDGLMLTGMIKSDIMAGKFI